jgi:hypothetical protein
MSDGGGCSKSEGRAEDLVQALNVGRGAKMPPRPWEKRRTRAYSKEDRERAAAYARHEAPPVWGPVTDPTPLSVIVPGADLTSPDKPHDPVRERSSYASLVSAFTGFGSDVVEKLAELVSREEKNAPLSDVLAACIVVHTSCTYEQLSHIMDHVFGVHRSTTYWHDHVSKVADVCADNPLTATYRYSEAEDDLFERATGALDGVPVFLKADDEHYNGKKKPCK